MALSSSTDVKLRNINNQIGELIITLSLPTKTVISNAERLPKGVPSSRPTFRYIKPTFAITSYKPRCLFIFSQQGQFLFIDYSWRKYQTNRKSPYKTVLHI